MPTCRYRTGGTGWRTGRRDRTGPSSSGTAAEAIEPTLVVDASAALDACTHLDGFAVFGEHRLVSPPLLWSEVRSALHEAVWRRAINVELAGQAQRRLDSGVILRRSPSTLGANAWAIADELGVAKTYDAEYLALARILRCLVVTTDARLRRGAERLGLVVGPMEL